jgi:hypothetical protein
MRERAKADPAFQAETPPSRPTISEALCRPPLPLYFAERLTAALGGAKIYFKREELNHTGAHKINNVLGQICSRGAWARSASSPRPAPASTASPPPRPAPLRPRMRRLHGRGRRRAAEAQCLPHEDARRRGRAGAVGRAHAEGRDERGAARLGDQCRRHVLLHRHGGRPASLSGDGARFPVRSSARRRASR